MRPAQGDIVLVPVPFTDLTSHRRRPVIVVSNDSYQAATADFVCVAMTSNLKVEPFSFEITSADLADGTLNRPGRVRADKVFTLAQAIIAARFGRVNQTTLDRIRRELSQLIS
ncbi:type II toxin-antitoxin system PemK/MazF family toxin [bacterium]|nr:type II toxin-antitoxin system PemK/MazF family toxin [bacterium]